MPPIITVDTSPRTHYVDAHHSTHQLTTLLHNDQLILVEIQGTLEYNLENGEHVGQLKLGDISWDETVEISLYGLKVGITGVFAHWTSSDGRTTSSSENTACRIHGFTNALKRVHRRQGMATAHHNTEETRLRHTSRASLSRWNIMMIHIGEDINIPFSNLCKLNNPL